MAKKNEFRGKLEETTRHFKRRARRQDAAVLAVVLREWNRLLAKLLVKAGKLKEAGASEAAAARAETLAKEAGEQVEALNEKLCPVIEKGQEAAIETGIEQAETVLAEAGVPANTMVRVNKEAFETMIGMTQDGSPLREVLDKGAGYSIKEAVMNVLKDGIAQGKNPEEIARDMMRLGYSSRKHALLVARTEVMRAYRISTKETYEANGVEKVIWCASESSGTCAACWAMDGRAFDLDKLPNDHPNGRCTIVPVIDDEEEETWDSEERFKERLTEEEQKKILGPRRHELWREGKLPWRDIPTVKPNEIYGPTVGISPLKEQYKAVGGQINAFNKEKDPCFDIDGKVTEKHKEEAEAMLQQLREWGVEIVDDGRGMSYQPHPSPSAEHPGQIHISFDDSYGAWLHEFKHAKDDHDNNWNGYEVYCDPVRRWKREYDAFMEEMRFARQCRRYDVAREILKDMRECKEKIFK